MNKIPSKRVIDLTGKIFDRLLVLEFSHIAKNRQSYWKVRCQCGKELIVLGNNLRRGHSRSCGCIEKENPNGLTHGLSSTRFYRIWGDMIKRCTNPKSKSYPDYGGRNIAVCERWLELFNNFKEDMYQSYLAHVKEFGESDTFIERILVNGNYEPENVRWATKIEQIRNRRNSVITENYDLHKYWRSRLTNLISYASTRGENFKESTRNFFIFYVGCSIEEFKQHIASQFEPWMNWDNYGKGIGKWSFDHINEINKFDLAIEQDRKDCFHYTNLRPYSDIQNNKEQRRDLVSI